jgi:hypothetical protein
MCKAKYSQLPYVCVRLEASNKIPACRTQSTQRLRITLKMTKAPRSKSDRPREILSNGQNVCRICKNPKKHKVYCWSKFQAELKRSESFASSEPDDQPEKELDLLVDIDERDTRNENEAEEDVQQFLRKHWESQKETLPCMYGNTTRGTLDRRIWSTWKFTTPDPFVVSPTMPSAFELSLGSVDVYVWCPHIFFQQYLSNFKLQCVRCGSSDVTLDGWSDSFRKVVGLTKCAYMICRRYKHMNCPVAATNGKSATVFNSCNNVFLESLPEIVRCQFDFLIGKRSAYKKEMCIYAREMQQCTSFKSASEVHRALITNSNMLQEKKYLLHMAEIRSPRNISSFLASSLCPPPEIISFGISKFASPPKIRKMAIEELHEQERYMNASMRSLTGRCLKIDHTFWVTKFVRERNGDQFYYAMFTVMNEYAEVMAFYFCTSKSLAEVREELKLIKRRYEGMEDSLQIIYTDNPRSDEVLLKEIFGDQVQVKRDIFHVLNDYFKACYKHPLRPWLMGELRRSFFTDEETDKELIINALLKSGYTMEQINKKDEKWFRSRSRKYIIDPDLIKENLEEVIQRYSSFSKLFKKEMKSKHKSIQQQLLGGYLTDPSDSSVYFDISTTDDSPKFITIRGTSQLESLHYHIQKVLEGPNCSEETIHLTLMDRFYRWNKKKGAINRQMESDLCFDPKLQHRVDSLRRQLGLPAKHKIETDVSSKPEEGFGILRKRFASEAYIASQELLTRAREGMVDLGSIREMVCERKGVIKRATPISTDSERALYKHLVKQTDSPEHLAWLWNDFVLDALTKQQQFIFLLDEENKQIQLQVSDLYLKDARHIDIFQNEKKKNQEAFLHFANSDQLSAFLAAQTKSKATSSSVKPLSPRPLLDCFDREEQKQDEAYQQNFTDDTVHDRSAKRTRKQSKPCTYCPSITRRHRKLDAAIQACPLHNYYKRRMLSIASSPAPRIRNESTYDAIQREYESLVAANYGR